MKLKKLKFRFNHEFKHSILICSKQINWTSKKIFKLKRIKILIYSKTIYKYIICKNNINKYVFMYVCIYGK